jgi:hypothetical protein
VTAFLGLFNAAKSHVVDFEGAPLFSMWPLDLDGPTRLTVAWDSYVRHPVQGLLLKTREGRLAVAGESSKSLVLWTDTAPPSVEVTCTPARQTMRIWLHNCWRDDSGGVMSSLGSAAMRVEEQDGGVIIRASDLTSPPDFNDLIVRIGVE